VVAPLGDVVRQAWDDDAGKAGDGSALRTAPRLSIECAVTAIPKRHGKVWSHLSC
jgi:hypothetical protein